MSQSIRIERHSHRTDRSESIANEPRCSAKQTSLRVPNVFLTTGLFWMRDRRDRNRPITDHSYEITSIKRRDARIEKGEHLDQFDADVYFDLLHQLHTQGKADSRKMIETTAEVSIGQVLKGLGQYNNSKRRQRVRESMMRLAKSEVMAFSQGTKWYEGMLVQCAPLLVVRVAQRYADGRIFKYGVSIEPTWHEIFTQKSYGWLDYSRYRQLSSPLVKALYRYVVGHPRKSRHTITVLQLRAHLGYKTALKNPRTFLPKIRKALQELEQCGVLSEINISDSIVKWKP